MPKNDLLAQVVASELGLKAVGASANVEVNLVDVNDHRPMFRNFNSKNGRHYEVPLHEQAKAGAIVTKVNYKYDVIFLYLNFHRNIHTFSAIV